MAGELQNQNGDRRCFVTAKVSSCDASTRVIRVTSLPIRWIALDPFMGRSGFLSSLLQDDEDQAHVNWKAVCGMALAFVVSAGFWAGVGVLIARVV